MTRREFLNRFAGDRYEYLTEEDMAERSIRDDLRSCNSALDDWHARERAVPTLVGYLECTCRDCHGFGIDGGLCWPCEEEGCSDTGDEECYRTRGA